MHLAECLVCINSTDLWYLKCCFPGDKIFHFPPTGHSHPWTGMQFLIYTQKLTVFYSQSWAHVYCAQSLPSCPSLCDPMDCNPPGSSVHGIFQERILERVAMPSFRDFSDPGIEPGSPAGKFFTDEPPRKPQHLLSNYNKPDPMTDITDTDVN